MRHLGLICAAFALGIFASPIAAQQTTPDQPVEQKMPPSVPPAPPPERQPSTESPPPFPPMSSHAPHHRFVDMGRHSTHSHATRSRHGSTTHRAHSSRHAITHAHSKAARAHQPEVRVTKKTERKCLKLSVKQALRNSDCKSLMRQQLQEEHHRAGRSKKHLKAAVRKASKHHMRRR